MATDYDEVRSDVAESRNASLEALRSANAPDARSVVRELDEADTSEGVELPGADLSGQGEGRPRVLRGLPQLALRQGRLSPAEVQPGRCGSGTVRYREGRPSNTLLSHASQ